MLEIGTKIPLFAEGDATSDDVIEGKTFSTSNGNNLEGNIKINLDSSFSPNKQDVFLNGYFKNAKIIGLNNLDKTNLYNLIEESLITKENINIINKIIENLYTKDSIKTSEIIKEIIKEKQIYNKKEITLPSKNFYNSDNETKEFILDFIPKNLIVEQYSYENSVFDLSYPQHYYNGNNIIFKSSGSDKCWIMLRMFPDNPKRMKFEWECSGFGKCSCDEVKVIFSDNDLKI